MTDFGGYDAQDHAEQLREDARIYIPPCDCCGKPTERGDFLSCRHTCCESCSAVAYPFECLACLREEVAADRNVFKRADGAQFSWHAGECGFALCKRTVAHEHLITENSEVVMIGEAA